jgi:hypothetical protein
MGNLKSENHVDPITTHGWALGRELRKALVAADFNQNVLAATMGCSETRLSRMLNGKLDPPPEEVAALLTLCGVVGERRDFLVRMAHERSIRAWGKPEQLGVLRSLRWDAGRIVEYSAVLLPELLWTDDYAEAVISRTLGVAEDEIPGLVGTVNNDKAMLSRTKAPHYEVILSEAALRLRVGSKQIMVEQLHHVVELGEQAGITIRVLPMAVGAHAGTHGSFALLTRPDLTVAVIEDAVSVQFVDDPDGLSVYVRITDTLRARALTPPESRDLINSIGVECHGYGGPDGHGGPGRPKLTATTPPAPVRTASGPVKGRSGAGGGR